MIDYIQNPDRFDDVFAYDNRLATVFHEKIMRKIHGEDVYAVNEKFKNDVLQCIDKPSIFKDSFKYLFL